MVDLNYATHAREPFFNIAKEIITENDKVLDIGAGNGKFADFCEREDFFLFEGNSQSALLLSKRFKNVEEGVLPILPYAKEFFDLIHMSHIIEHLNPQEVYDSLKEMNRCCKPGGRLVISAPLLWSGFYNDLSHERPYPPESFVKYMTKLGPTATRSLISDKFKVERLQYRFLPHEREFRKRRTSKLIDKVLYKIQSYLKSPEMQYERTGYTLVLKKDQ